MIFAHTQFGPQIQRKFNVNRLNMPKHWIPLERWVKISAFDISNKKHFSFQITLQVICKYEHFNYAHEFDCSILSFHRHTLPIHSTIIWISVIYTWLTPYFIEETDNKCWLLFISENVELPFSLPLHNSNDSLTNLQFIEQFMKTHWDFQ